MGPELLELQLTGSCNLKCEYCGNSEAYLHDAKANLNTIIKSINELHPERVLFTGGEVYLEWDLLFSVLELLKGKNLKYTLSSNLTLISTDELDLLIDQYGFDTFHSSFNDLDDSMTFSIRQGLSLERTHLMRNLMHLCNRGMNVRVETMVIKKTIDHLVEINQLLSGLGVKQHKLEFLIPLGQAGKDIGVDYIKALDKALEVYQNKKSGTNLILCCFPFSPCVIEHPIFYISKPDLEFNRCVDGKESCYLLANGKLLPCFLYPDNMIAKFYDSYMDQWLYGEEFAGMREENIKCTECDNNYENKQAIRKICSMGCKVYNYVTSRYQFGTLPRY